MRDAENGVTARRPRAGYASPYPGLILLTRGKRPSKKTVKSKFGEREKKNHPPGTRSSRAAGGWVNLSANVYNCSPPLQRSLRFPSWAAPLGSLPVQQGGWSRAAAARHPPIFIFRRCALRRCCAPPHSALSLPLIARIVGAERNADRRPRSRGSPYRDPYFPAENSSWHKHTHTPWAKFNPLP